MVPPKRQPNAKESASPEPRSVDALRVDLDQLELGSQPLVAGLSQAWVAEILSETDAIADGDGAVSLELTVQADRTVLVRGSLQLSYTVPCARCLEPALVDVGVETGELCVTFIPADRLRSWAEFSGAPEDEDEIEPLDASELDEIGYEGSIVDLRAFLAEQILLAYPMRALCSRGEACLGLCMRCGTNLNLAETAPDSCPGCGLALSANASAADEAADSPWKQALAKVKADDLS
ncbi:hypothetical protein ENSA5_63490 [Enhygromyxa salina]|uniref:DUF177 domain-containing protein n=1 Tax=Enhygromyxa salina TaxID=215803 RepID=A0A2S9XCG5_9BACT|nr:YceD family protein [Enhygromyxa salina]PRP90546.1 hypothetical protein ENSA5_63490 [Enhygromyxa salina]